MQYRFRGALVGAFIGAPTYVLIVHLMVGFSAH